LKSGELNLEKALPGGLIGIETNLDPSLTKADQLVGNIVGLAGRMPKVWNTINVSYTLFEQVVGTKEPIKVEPIKLKEEVVLNVGPARTIGIVTQVKKDTMTVNLGNPVCGDLKTKVAISRKIQGKWRLVGYGELV